MSALTSKADISRRHLNVRFVPIADMTTAGQRVQPVSCSAARSQYLGPQRMLPMQPVAADK